MAAASTAAAARGAAAAPGVVLDSGSTPTRDLEQFWDPESENYPCRSLRLRILSLSRHEMSASHTSRLMCAYNLRKTSSIESFK
eukprot:COSAG01_NODE_7308_length_3257_cov_67.059531_1_plen_84_part_00